MTDYQETLFIGFIKSTHVYMYCGNSYVQCIYSQVRYTHSQLLYMYKNLINRVCVPKMSYKQQTDSTRDILSR